MPGGPGSPEQNLSPAAVWEARLRTQTCDGSSLYVLAEAHVRDETAANIWTCVTRARADREEIQILQGSSG